MHILHILDHSIPVQDGYSYRSLALLRGQHALGWKTSHLTSAKHGEGPGIVETVDGFEFHRTAPERGLLARLPLAGQFSFITGMQKRLDELIPKLQPDVLHAHSPALNGVAAVKAGRKHGLPVVYEVRGFWEDAAVDNGTVKEGDLRYRATRAMETWVLKRADQVTCICEGLRADIAERGIPTAKMTVIPNGADPTNMSERGTPAPELLKKFGLEGKTVLGFVGSFYAYEGLHLLVEAMAHLARQRDDIKVVLVGGGLEEARIDGLIAQRDLAGHVVRVGRVPQHEVERYYDLIDILVYPRSSMRITELVTPMKPLEAMVRKQIVLASDVGGHKELITHGENGYLFPADDAHALADAVLELIDRRQAWAAVQQAARQYVLEERSWIRSVSRYPGVYDAIAG